MAPPTPDPAVLMDELVEEFLLRLPPEDPALLARAALVSRQWYRVVTGPSFRRRFRDLYRSTPPLLGYILSLDDSIRFVPLSSFRPPRTQRGGVPAISSSHGRVLLHRLFEEDLVGPRHSVKGADVHLSVWHPITDEQQDLPVVPLRPTRIMHIIRKKGYKYNWDAAVVRALGDGCDHLHCRFMVVFVGIRKCRNFSCFYSSEAGSWSDPVFASEGIGNPFIPGKFVLIGTALYTMYAASDKIFKYDSRTHQMCNISITPRPGSLIAAEEGRLIVAEDGRLGFVRAFHSILRLWLRDNGRLEASRDIDLRTLLPADAIQPLYARVTSDTTWVVAFAETGAGVIFLWTCAGYFSIDLKSGSCKKVGEVSWGHLVPYVSFCTPAPGAGVAISSDEVPVADIAVPTDRDQELVLRSLQMRGQELLACVKCLRSSNFKCKGL